jgi:hypothetical protein
MNRHPLFLTICTVVAGAAVAGAQEPIPPVPPVPPAAPAAPQPVPAPIARPFFRDDMDDARAQMDSMRSQIRDAARTASEEAREMARAGFDFHISLAPQIQFGQRVKIGRHDSEDRAYERGQRALDNRNWDEALEMFTQAAGSGGSRADGALYWKAYALSKLGRRDDALAAIAELRKSYASSRWLDDAKALELEVKQAGGQKPSPEMENNEDLKLLALNGLVQSDPDRALPLVENLLKTSSSPKLKERALFVLAESNSSRGKQLLEQVARGSAGNPDLQLKAIRYVSATSKKTDNRQLLWEIYSSSNDIPVKRAILNGLMNSNDKDHLLQIAKSEKSTPLRMEAITYLGASGAQSELWQIYQGETSADVKQEILHSMIASGSADRLVEIAKTEKDAKLRRSAVHALGSMNAAKTGDALVSMYGSETDPGMKKSIVEGLHSQRNAKALVDLSRKESDPAMKREIVAELSTMKSKEATDYLMELLK